MAVRNTALPGGTTNWIDGEIPNITDLNDTFTACTNKIKSLSTFWLDSYLYSVYDDFESYSVGTISDARWSISSTGNGGTATFTCASSTYAGGSGKEGVFTTAGSGSFNRTLTGTLVCETLTANKHVHFKVLVSGDVHDSAGDCYASVSIDNSNYYTIVSMTPGYVATHNVDIIVIANGSNSYDLYVGSKRVQSSVSISPLKVYFRSESQTYASCLAPIIVYIDDVYQSAYTS